MSSTGLLLRRLAWLGARHGPAWWLRGSPPVFGVLGALAAPDARRAVLRNLRRLEAPRWRTPLDVTRTFAAYGACLAEGLAAGRREWADATLELEGARELAQLGRSEGAVLVTAHVGAWDCAAGLLARRHPVGVTLVMAPEPDAGARRFHDAVRAARGVEVVHTGGSPLDGLALLSSLRRGRWVCFQLDRTPPGSRRLAVSCLGVPGGLPEGPFRLAALAGRPLVAVFVAREGSFRYRALVGPVLRPSRSADSTELARGAREVAARLDEFLRRYPTQWFDFGE